MLFTLFSRYPNMTDEMFAERCPVCLDICNCKSCLRDVHPRVGSCSSSFVMELIPVPTLTKIGNVILNLLVVFRSKRRLILNLIMFREFDILFISYMCFFHS